MRIAMIGSGAMGAMFGARFAQTGADVILYDVDEAHIAAIVARGLSLETPDGGKPGIRTEVSRENASRMIVDGRARLANKSEAADHLKMYRLGAEPEPK